MDMQQYPKQGYIGLFRTPLKGLGFMHEAKHRGCKGLSACMKGRGGLKGSCRGIEGSIGWT